MSATDNLPKFSQIDIKNFPENLEKLLNANKRAIDKLIADDGLFDWDHLMLPLDELDDEISHLWAPISHLHSVLNSEELRHCYQQCLPLLSDYSAEIGQNKALYQAIDALQISDLNDTQKKIREDDLLAFKLSGVTLDAEKRDRYKAIQKRLSELSNQFENNVLDATQAWTKHITDEAMLSGLPEHAIATAKTTAEAASLPGWVLTLEFPSYYAVITYANDRSLREEFYHAYVTRASELGPNAGKFDNTAIIDEILTLRQEKAQLLDFANYAELSLATKMAESTEQVVEFLTDLSTRAIKQAEKEYESLERFALSKLNLQTIEPWDISYCSEKLRQHRFTLSQEDLRPYFPQPKVMQGMFEIVNKLYGVHLKEREGVNTWHPDVEFYELFDDQGQLRGQLYVDLYARANKRSGAWMDECQVRRRKQNGELQLPVAFLTCNFAPACDDKPACLSHDEVVTLFHEFGHCLHHLLTTIDYSSASGINGVEWDAVELPSQFLENWCWQQPALELLSEHVETKEALPHDHVEKLLAAKNFQSAMTMMKQLEYALFDFKIHLESTPSKPHFVSETIEKVRNQVSVLPRAAYNRFQHSFSHIFAGGYAAGYYSYKWAEVLSSDAFNRFEKEGIFNQHTGRDFLHFILEKGGSRKALELFKGFRGRKPKVDALLKHSGIK